MPNADRAGWVTPERASEAMLAALNGGGEELVIEVI